LKKHVIRHSTTLDARNITTLDQNAEKEKKKKGSGH
jgi:hypothetical protein